MPDVPLYCGTKHSSATAARRAGVALETIQHALGHADRRSTERYARAAELAPVEVLQPFGSEIRDRSRRSSRE